MQRKPPYRTRQVLVSDVIQVEPHYGYSICLGRQDWQEIVERQGDPHGYIAESLDITVNDNVCLHMDAAQVAEVFDTIAMIDLEGI